MIEQTVRIPEGDPAGQNINFLWSAIDEVLIVAITDLNGVITHVNDRFCHISGYDRHELIGHTHRVLNSGYHSQAFFVALYRTISAGEIWRGKICNRAKNGSLYWVATTIIPRKDEAGRILSYVAYRFDVTPLVEARNKMKRLSRQDPLVDGLNRIGFAEALAEFIQQSVISGENRLLVMIDLNGFKEVNDIYGHDVGDLVLIEAARRLRRFAGTDAVIGRLGGDEFAVLMRVPTNCIETSLYLQRLLDLIEQPILTGVTAVSVSASIGYTKIEHRLSSGQQFLKDVDVALLQAKHESDRSIVAFTPSLRSRARRQQQILSDARLGIERGEFELYYQPIINLSQGCVIICESLLRWHHPQQGLLTPAVFSEVFNDFRTGLALGKFVREVAIRDVALWMKNGTYDGGVSINLSVSDFGVDSLARELSELTDNAGVPRSKVWIEITETIFLGTSRSDRVRREITSLANHGFRIAFDDFGTGYAAISHLRELPLTDIKIDRSFVANIEQDGRDRKITAGLLGLAHSIDLSTVAEGVETVEQFRILNGLGCTACQGYLFGHAVPAVEVPSAVMQACSVLDNISNSADPVVSRKTA
ncbi:putative bifunctional diguanylate cyclase/phosphodiesterase [Acetobacter conturbans]|uniref:EAL domain-containing protein n=1 Tax=Acetobacter conturbans TaxID=1737472 RepID=A0ABX0JWX0_9PROT|nr:GGDEF domain-containing phosphodiesterase [Acetobacter conturbans]NHN87809.1 EAL domain-containing protein [Acetobacter conturbans]